MSTTSTLQLIETLCENAASKISVSDTGCVTQAGYGESRLLQNGINIHDLDKNELVSAILGLTKILSPTSNLIYINEDQTYLWAWCAQIFTDSNTPIRHEIHNDTLRFMRLVTHTALSRFNLRAFSKTGINIGVHSRAILTQAHQSLIFLTLPLLEALLRFSCRSYVGRDGSVIQSFRVQDGKHYKPTNKCSNLGHLIDLYRNVHQAIIEKQCAIQILNLVEQTRPNANIARWLFGLRNAALHGETLHSNAAAIILNICFSLCLGELSHDSYSSERDRIYQGVLWSNQLPERPEWSIYPPEF